MVPRPERSSVICSISSSLRRPKTREAFSGPMHAMSIAALRRPGISSPFLSFLSAVSLFLFVNQPSAQQRHDHVRLVARQARDLARHVLPAKIFAGRLRDRRDLFDFHLILGPLDRAADKHP